MAVVGANCVLRVDVNIGKHAHARDGDQASKSGVGGDDTGGDDVSGYKRSSAVQVSCAPRSNCGFGFLELAQTLQFGRGVILFSTTEVAP